MENRVFASLANGDVVVYYRDPSIIIHIMSLSYNVSHCICSIDSGGIWNINDPHSVTIGSVVAPVTRMLPVNNVLWCSAQNNVKILDLASLCVDVNQLGKKYLKKNLTGNWEMNVVGIAFTGSVCRQL